MYARTNDTNIYTFYKNRLQNKLEENEKNKKLTFLYDFSITVQWRA